QQPQPPAQPAQPGQPAGEPAGCPGCAGCAGGCGCWAPIGRSAANSRQNIESIVKYFTPRLLSRAPGLKLQRTCSLICTPKSCSSSADESWTPVWVYKSRARESFF